MMRKTGGLFACAALLAALLPAQTWPGDQAVALQVSDAKGRPLAGARVVFTFQGVPGETGPDIVATDGRGRAVVAGLAPGPWQVEVSHLDYLTYIAMLDIRRGKKPLVSASFLEAGGRSLAPVKVKFSKGDNKEPSPVLEARQPVLPAEPQTAIAETAEPPTAPRVEETRQEPTRETTPGPTPRSEPEVDQEPVAEVPEPTQTAAPSEPERQAPAPSAEPMPIGEPAPPGETAEPTTEVEEAVTQADEAATAAPQPTEPVVESPPLPPVAVPETRAEPAVEAPPTAQLPSPTELEPPASAPTAEQAKPEPDELQRTVKVEPIPEPAPETPTPAELAPAPETPTPAELAPAPVAAQGALPPPRDPGTRVTSHSDGSCADCGSAEWTLEVSVPVPARASGSPRRCDAEVLAAAEPAMVGLSTSIQLELDSFIGPVASQSPHEAIGRAEPDLVTPFQSALADFVEGASPCQLVGLVLPKGLRFSRVVYGASDQEGSGPCAPGQTCAIGDCLWLGSARVERGPSSTIVYGLFENLSTERGRRAILRVYYRPPNAKWQPRLPTGGQ